MAALEHLRMHGQRPLEISGYDLNTADAELQTDTAKKLLDPAIGCCLTKRNRLLKVAFIIYKLTTYARQFHMITVTDTATGQVHSRKALHKSYYGYAVHQDEATVGEIPRRVRDWANSNVGLFIAAVPPVAENTAHGLTNYHGATSQHSDAAVTYNEDPSTLAIDAGYRCTLKVVEYNETTARRVTTANIDRTGPKPSTTPLSFSISEHEATRSVILTAAKADSTQIDSINHRCTLTTGPPNSTIKWLTTQSPTRVTVQLAPAFAALSSSWLDRNMITALTAAANWAGGSRTSEVEPHARAAIRQAANTNIDLTRVYVRLWALALDAAAQNSTDTKAYQPMATYTGNQPVRFARSYNEWVTGLIGATSGITPAIYHDEWGTSTANEILPVLSLAAATAIAQSPTASWLWPPIRSLTIYTNASYNSGVNMPIYYASIISTINWLSESTSTYQQADEARMLTMAVAYRK
jgi:hypothetical protein